MPTTLTIPHGVLHRLGLPEDASAATITSAVEHLETVSAAVHDQEADQVYAELFPGEAGPSGPAEGPLAAADEVYASLFPDDVRRG